MPRRSRHVDHNPPLDLDLVLPLASVFAGALTPGDGLHDVGFQRQAYHDVPGLHLVPRETQATVERDPGAGNVKQHLVDLRIELSGISVVLIIPEMEICEPSVFWGDEHYRLPDWTPTRLDFRSASEIELRQFLLIS